MDYLVLCLPGIDLSAQRNKVTKQHKTVPDNMCAARRILLRASPCSALCTTPALSFSKGGKTSTLIFLNSFSATYIRSLYIKVLCIRNRCIFVFVITLSAHELFIRTFKRHFKDHCFKTAFRQ